MSKNVQKKSAYCKVCYDAGKPEKEYTSHYVKDRNGVTTCPTLLNTECRNCFKKGHTFKFCKAVKKEVNIFIKVEKKADKNKKNENVFSSLYLDDEKQETEEVKKPTLSGWAAIAAKPAVVKNQKQEMVVLSAEYFKAEKAKKLEEEKAKKEMERKPAPWASAKYVKSWAALSDDEDEYEDINDDISDITYLESEDDWSIY